MHVWWIALDRGDDDPLATLSAAERARAARMQNPADGARWSAARVALRQILARYLALPPAALEFAAGPWGKPELAANARLRFSLAHAGDRAALAVTWRREVGIDLEPLDTTLALQPLVAAACSAVEAAHLNALPPGERAAAFLTGWTVKESYLKGIGTGLRRDPRGITVTITADGRAALDDPLAGPPAECWRSVRLAAPPGWVAALAVAAPRATIHTFSWPLPAEPEIGS